MRAKESLYTYRLLVSTSVILFNLYLVAILLLHYLLFAIYYLSVRRNTILLIQFTLELRFIIIVIAITSNILITLNIFIILLLRRALVYINCCTSS